MKEQINKKPPAFTAITIISILILIGSCSKDTKGPDNGRSTTGTSKIIYTEVNPDSLIISTSWQLYNLDLNNDGITDFVFSVDTLTFSCGGASDYAYKVIAFLSVNPAAGSNAVMANGSDFALASDSATVIAPNSLWAATSQVLLSGIIDGAGRCNVIPPVVGLWLNGSDKYLGLKFINGNNTFYGWARLSAGIERASLILKDYAYNSIPNQPILAGQTK